MLPNKTDRLVRLSREGIWVIFGQVGMIVGTLASARVMTELLTPRAFGELSLLLTIVACTNLIFFGPVCNGVERFYSAAREADDLSGYLGGTKNLLVLYGAVIASLAILSAAILRVADYGWWSTAGLLTVGLALFAGSSSVITSIHNAARRRPIVAVQQTLDALLRPAFAAPVLLCFAQSALAALVGYATAAGCLLALNCVSLRNVCRQMPASGSSAGRWQREIYQYSWPIAAWGVFTWMQQVSSRWALATFTSPDDVGSYVLLYQFGVYPMVLFGGAMTQLMTPVIFQRVGDATSEHRTKSGLGLVWKLVGVGLLVTATGWTLASAFHGEVFKLLIAKTFEVPSQLLPVMILAGGVFAIAQTLSIHLMSTMKTRFLAYGKIGTAILGIIFNIVGAYWHGLGGVVIADLMFSVVYLLTVALIVTYASAKGGAAVFDAV